MPQKLDEFFNVNISKLSIAGLVLLGFSMGLGLGASMAIAMGSDVGYGEHLRRGPARRIALLAWVAAALVYFGGRAAFNALGVSADRNTAGFRRRTMADWALTRGIVGFSAFGLACALAFAVASSTMGGPAAQSASGNAAIDVSTLPTNPPAPPESGQAGHVPLQYPATPPGNASPPDVPASPAVSSGFDLPSVQSERAVKKQEGKRTVAEEAPEHAIPRHETKMPRTEKKSPARSAPATDEFRTWSDATGKFTIQGKLVSNADGNVTIERRDGSQVTIPLKKLNKADRGYLDSIDEEEDAGPTPDSAAGGDTELIGGAGGWVFRKEGPGPLLGIRYRLGSWDNEQCLAPIEPIFDQQTPRAGQMAVTARDGYAVGAINIDAKRFVNSIQIVFMRLKPGGGLDPLDSYTSPWIGFPTGLPTKTLGGSGAIVIGIYGRQGAVLEAIGLILRGSGRTS